MEIIKPEQKKIKIYLPEVREILENDVFLKWGLDLLEGISEEEKDTKRHTQRVTNCGYLLAKHFAKRHNLSREDIELFVETCLFHDIGKIEVPLKHLTRSVGTFGSEDRIIMSRHSYDGYEILKENERSPRVYFPVLLHHTFQENPYPEINAELRKQIKPIDKYNGRLLAIIDVFDRVAFGSSNIKPLAPDERKPRLTKQFNQKEDEKIIDFLMSQYETIKGLSKD